MSLNSSTLAIPSALRHYHRWGAGQTLEILDSISSPGCDKFRSLRPRSEKCADEHSTRFWLPTGWSHDKPSNRRHHRFEEEDEGRREREVLRWQGKRKLWAFERRLSRWVTLFRWRLAKHDIVWVELSWQGLKKQTSSKDVGGKLMLLSHWLFV